jgi:hypothetical protein
MRQVAVLAGALLVILGGTALAPRAPSDASVIGVWLVAERTVTGPNARIVTTPQPGVYIFTKSYYSIDQVISDAPRPELPSRGATTAQFVDACRLFKGKAGTYEIKGNEIIYKTKVAKSPNVMRDGNSAIDTFRIEGKDTLWLIEKSNPEPGIRLETIKLTRVE